ncbi:MAG: class I SAM-dependent methyltransferase [Nocardioides sp.]
MPDPMPDYTDILAAATAQQDRPPIPPAAVEWLSGSPGTSLVVLDFQAGIGRLSEILAGLGHEVYAVDASDELLAQLRVVLPDVPTAISDGTQIPLPDGRIGVVVWSEPRTGMVRASLSELSRILEPAGRLAMAWHLPDQRIPWVRRLSALVGSAPEPPDLTMMLSESGLFSLPETATFSHWEHLDAEGFGRFAARQPIVAAADAERRADILAEVGELYAEYERGIDGLRLPYVTHCLRAERITPPADDSGPTRGPANGDPDDDGISLIDLG